MVEADCVDSEANGVIYSTKAMHGRNGLCRMTAAEAWSLRSLFSNEHGESGGDTLGVRADVRVEWYG